jgi:hypothetical protein
MKPRNTSRWWPALVSAAALVLPNLTALADRLESRWSLAPLSRSYLGTNNLERGLAYDAVTDRVILVSRLGGNRLVLLDGATGSDGSDEANGVPIRTLSTSDETGANLVTGGDFVMNLAGAGSDGAVYVANLSLAVSKPFKIYRWASAQPETVPTIAWEGTMDTVLPTGATGNDARFGDSFAVRGSGTNTVLGALSRSGKYLVLFRTADGTTFSPTVLTANFTANAPWIGLAFGADNVFYADGGGTAGTLRCDWNLTAGTFRTVATYANGAIPTAMGPLAVGPGAERLALVDTAAHTLRAYDISIPADPLAIGTAQTFPRTVFTDESGNPVATNLVANVNGTGAAAVGPDAVFALDTNNGLLAYTVVRSVEPPVIATQPASATVWASSTVALSVGASGSRPLSYQWTSNGVVIPSATSASLTLTNLGVPASAAYAAIVSNPAQSITSAPAVLTVRQAVNTPVLTPLWRILPGERTTVAQDNNQRGLAYNPATGNVLYVSRTGGNRIVVLDGATGAERHQLKTTDEAGVNVITGGTLVINMVAVADDGAVYVANLVTDGSTGLKVYRWESDSATVSPTVLSVTGLPAGVRFGDNMDARGSGDSTQLLFASRSHKSFAVVDIVSGAVGTVAVYDAAALGNGNIGLSVAFGAGNSVWGTASGQTLVHVAFEPGVPAATVRTNLPGSLYPTSVGLIAVDASAGLLAGLSFDNPDNVQVSRLGDLSSAPALLDQELLPLKNANGNGTGAADFGGGRLYVLDSNNGIHAYTVQASATVAGGPATLSDVSVSGGFLRFRLNGTAGAVYQVRGGTNLAEPAGLFLQSAAPGGTPGVVPSTADQSFLRAVPVQ